jgi:uncharacterized protein YcbK (DUF882 family)
MKIGNFDTAELACHDPRRGSTPYPPAWLDDVTRGIPLLRLLNAIRDLTAHALIIVSGYRTPEHNADLIADDTRRGLHGVASGSQHIEGRAADIHSVTGAQTPEELHALIHSAYLAGKLPDLGGLGLYMNWVHVDVRERVPDNHLAQWGRRIL